jgi:hypothetical protein
LITQLDIDAIGGSIGPGSFINTFGLAWPYYYNVIAGSVCRARGLPLGRNWCTIARCSMRGQEADYLSIDGELVRVVADQAIEVSELLACQQLPPAVSFVGNCGNG